VRASGRAARVVLCLGSYGPPNARACLLEAGVFVFRARGKSFCFSREPAVPMGQRLRPSSGRRVGVPGVNGESRFCTGGRTDEIMKGATGRERGEKKRGSVGLQGICFVRTALALQVNICLRHAPDAPPAGQVCTCRPRISSRPRCARQFDPTRVIAGWHDDMREAV